MKPFSALMLDRLPEISIPMSRSFSKPLSHEAAGFQPFECSAVYPLAVQHFCRLHGHVEPPLRALAGLADIPPAPPPFSFAWYEWRDDAAPGSGRPHVGVAAISFDETDPRITDWNKGMDPRTRAFFEDFTDGARWTQVLVPHLAIAGEEGILKPPVICVTALDRTGKPLRNEFAMNGVLVSADELDRTPIRPGRRATYFDVGLGAQFMVALFFQALLGCKNVERERVEPPPALEKKRLRRRGALPFVRYHTLKVRVPGTGRYWEPVSRGEHEAEPRGLHMVRGHFKRYTADKPLLGRAVGTFYWPPMLRGSLAAGSVGKHYEEAPRKETE